METQEYQRSQLIATLMKIPHGKLENYIAPVLPAAKSDPELFAHLICWNMLKGEVRDSKVAFPVLALRGMNQSTSDLAENAVGNWMLLGPREVVKAYHFNHDLSAQGSTIPSGYRRMLEKALNQYLGVREANRKWWDKAVVSSREAMTALYAISHRNAPQWARDILFNKIYPNGSVFEMIRNLRDMTPQEAAGVVLQYQIPVQVAIGAVAKAKDPDIALALIEQMSANELAASSNFLKKLGVMENPVLRGAYEAAVERAKEDKRATTLKASKVVEVLGEEDALVKKLIKVQESRLEKTGGIEGDWLVLGDKSGSMEESIKLAAQISALLAQQVKGKVHLVMFDVSPRYIDVTGCTLEQINGLLKHVTAGGGTSIGCGLELMVDRKQVVNGIAVVSDGGDNHPPYFQAAYAVYSRTMGIEPAVYFFKLPGQTGYYDKSLERQDVRMDTFDLKKDVDYYSLTNIVKTMKTSRWGLLTEIMETPLVTLQQVFGG